MNIEECRQIMSELTEKEEQRLGVNSPEFQKRHAEIMEGCNKQQELIQDLMLEQNGV